MVSGGASAIESDLATGTTASRRARRRWPILDVHNVKQPAHTRRNQFDAEAQIFHVRRNHGFRRRASNARNLHARRFRRCASPRSPIRTRAYPLADDARATV